MKKIKTELTKGFTAFVLLFLNTRSLAQNNELNLFYSSQQQLKSKIKFQIIGINSEPSFTTTHNWNLKISDTLPKQPSITLLRNENVGIWKKVGRAELFIGGAELFGMSVLMLSPKEVTGWSSDWMQDAWRNVKRSFLRAPVWDDDDWQLNYIGHPVAGSFYYNSLRSQNASVFHSFLFATAQSFIWEYFIEATAEKPSTQDLIVTPIAGAILGESVHRITMNMRRNGFNFFEKVFVLVFNPMFALNNGFGSRFNPVKQNY